MHQPFASADAGGAFYNAAHKHISVKLTLGKTGNPPFAKKRNRRGNRTILAVRPV
jgi:hypothetical protein